MTFWCLIEDLNGVLALCDNCRTLWHKLETAIPIIEKGPLGANFHFYTQVFWSVMARVLLGAQRRNTGLRVVQWKAQVYRCAFTRSCFHYDGYCIALSPGLWWEFGVVGCNITVVNRDVMTFGKVRTIKGADPAESPIAREKSWTTNGQWINVKNWISRWRGIKGFVNVLLLWIDELRTPSS